MRRPCEIVFQEDMLEIATERSSRAHEKKTWFEIGLKLPVCSPAKIAFKVGFFHSRIQSKMGALCVKNRVFYEREGSERSSVYTLQWWRNSDWFQPWLITCFTLLLFLTSDHALF